MHNLMGQNKSDFKMIENIAFSFNLSNYILIFVFNLKFNMAFKV